MSVDDRQDPFAREADPRERGSDPSSAIEGGATSPPEGSSVHDERSALLDERRARRRGRMFGAISGTAAAVFAVAFIGLTLWSPDGSVVRIPLEGTDLAPDALATAVVTETDAGWSITLDVDELDPSTEGTYYQAWMRGGTGAVSLGTFRAGGSKEVITLWSGVALRDYPELAVTLQHEGGGAESSGQVVLIGSVADD